MIQEDPQEEEMTTPPIFLPGESHGQRSLAGYSPWSHKESDMTKRLSTHMHIAWYIVSVDCTGPEKALAAHFGPLAWKISWMEEPGKLQSMGLLRVGHSWATSLSLFTFHFNGLGKEMATHSSVLAWRIPGTGESGGLPSMGSHRVGHDWSHLAAAADCIGQFESLHLLFRLFVLFVIKLYK